MTCSSRSSPRRPGLRGPHREREYAAALGKPILPIRVAPVSAGILPPALGRVNVVDYTKPDTFGTTFT